MVDIVAGELNDLKDVDIITFDVILLQAYVYYAQQKDLLHLKCNKSLTVLFYIYCYFLFKTTKLPKSIISYLFLSYLRFFNCGE